MHAYDRPTTCPDPFPSLAEFPFHDALDVVAYAEVDLAIGALTWPEAWHLDENGVMACAYKGSSLDSLAGWAKDPSDLERSWLEGVANHGCTGRWLIVDSRPAGFADPPTEADARAFLTLRQRLADAIHVDLADAIVFDDRGHWWSMHELTSGTTSWTAPS